jgi:hypothetical protein
MIMFEAHSMYTQTLLPVFAVCAAMAPGIECIWWRNERMDLCELTAPTASLCTCSQRSSFKMHSNAHVLWWGDAQQCTICS